MMRRPVLHKSCGTSASLESLQCCVSALCYMLLDRADNTGCKLKSFQDAGISKCNTKILQRQTFQGVRVSQCLQTVWSRKPGAKLCCQCWGKAEDLMQWHGLTYHWMPFLNAGT